MTVSLYLCIILVAMSTQSLINFLTNPIMTACRDIWAVLELRCESLARGVNWGDMAEGVTVGVEQPWNWGENSSKNDRQGPTLYKGWQGKHGSPEGVPEKGHQKSPWPQGSRLVLPGVPPAILPGHMCSCSHLRAEVWKNMCSQGEQRQHSTWESQMSPVKPPLNRWVRRFLSQRKSRGYFLFSSLCRFSSDIPFLNPERNAYS